MFLIAHRGIELNLGPFRVDPEKELLLRDNEAVPLAPKAFQVLLVLIRHKKEIATKMNS
jgi:DNA-binding winged helix-turn-helix (wHTH) protein